MLPPEALLLRSVISCGLEKHIEDRNVNMKYFCAPLLSVKGSRQAVKPRADFQ